MKVIITVGSVQLSMKGLDLTRKEVRALLMDVASIASAMAEEPAAPETPNPVGFSAHVERAAEPEPESIFSDDELE